MKVFFNLALISVGKCTSYCKQRKVYILPKPNPLVEWTVVNVESGRSNFNINLVDYHEPRENKFTMVWNSVMPLNNTLYFYNIVKSEITFEPYLKINKY